ncbi:MAG: S8 family serine peptidase [Bacteroidetes bacterium]|nr:S8 family serine peptidase [Bacteroidota bacterium]
MKIHQIHLLLIGIVSLMGINGAALAQIPSSAAMSTVPRTRTLTEKEALHWAQLDPVQDTIPGMSVDRAYTELVKKRKGQTVLVAIIDSGIDLGHEDLRDLLWKNPREIAGDGIDNDQNGYVDDFHGYNFLGESYEEQLEFVRILAKNLGDRSLQKRARTLYETQIAKAKASVTQFEQIEQFITTSHQNIQKKLGKETYTLKELETYAQKGEEEERAIWLLTQVLETGQDIPSALADLKERIAYYQSQLDFRLNLEFDGRKPVGDNPYDLKDQTYGNVNPSNRKENESHGTHVAGILAANRENNKGVKGVAQSVQLMALRAVPDGDEYDKDIALAIRYAVDQAAKVINASFGKKLSPNASWVQEALQYAASKDVLFVHAAGNDGVDLDNPENTNFPNDQYSKMASPMNDNYLTVGALTSNYGSDMIASFSNYGKISVDIFAPGDEIYSTLPSDSYGFEGGTSMAAPAVAGMAALIRSLYPQLTAVQVRQVILDSGLTVPFQVRVGNQERTLEDLCTSGKIANLYTALLLAEQLAGKNKGKGFK